jgi:hypothetical protein
VFSNVQAMDAAVRCFAMLEAQPRRAIRRYVETLARAGSLRRRGLSDQDMNVKKSMNNHLPVLEEYTHSCACGRTSCWRPAPWLIDISVGTPQRVRHALQPTLRRDVGPQVDSYTSPRLRGKLAAV